MQVLSALVQQWKKLGLYGNETCDMGKFNPLFGFRPSSVGGKISLA
jgi:hypothetical protein